MCRIGSPTCGPTPAWAPLRLRPGVGLFRPVFAVAPGRHSSVGRCEFANQSLAQELRELTQSVLDEF